MGRCRGGRSFLCGLTLIEVGVSVAILGGVVVGLLAVRARALGSSVTANEMMTCSRLCASQVTQLRAGLLGEGEGTFARPAGYTWEITRSTLPEDAPVGLDPYEIRVTPASGDEAAAVAVTVWLLTPVGGEEGEP